MKNSISFDGKHFWVNGDGPFTEQECAAYNRHRFGFEWNTGINQARNIFFASKQFVYLVFRDEGSSMTAYRSYESLVADYYWVFKNSEGKILTLEQAKNTLDRNGLVYVYEHEDDLAHYARIEKLAVL